MLARIRFRRSVLGLATSLVLGVGSSAFAQAPAPATLPDAPAPLPTPISPVPDYQPGIIIADEQQAPSRMWASAEYLLWQIKGEPLATPLLTTGPIDAVGPSGRPGVLGGPGTQVLLGGEDVNFGMSSGGRFSAGYWFGDCQTIGVEGNYLFLNQVSSSHAISAPGLPGTPPLSIPFSNVTIPGEDSTGVALPTGSGFSGIADLTVSTRLQGAELNTVLPLCTYHGIRLEALGGFRWINIDESLHFTTVSTNVPPLMPDVFDTSDRFSTQNNFYAGQFGARARYQWNRLGLDLTGKIALGGVHEETQIRGSLLTNDFTNIGPVQAFPGGYFALPTNIGDFSRDHFAAAPEVDLNFDYRVTDHIKVFAGYTFLYVSNVARPGEEIDRAINPTQGPAFTGVPSSAIAGPVRPTYQGHDGSFFAHGLNVGLEVSY
jgi:hypothetical protein